MMKYIIWIVVIIVLVVGGYYAYTTYAPATGAPAPGETSEDIVQAQDVTVGTGTEATPGSIVSVLYVGSLQDGTVFDSSEAHGNEPLVFQLGTPGLIPGFQIGVNGMKVGGERLIAVPPAYGYGDQAVTNPDTGEEVVPANSTLIFNVQLLDVQEAPPADATTSETSETPAAETSAE